MNTIYLTVATNHKRVEAWMIDTIMLTAAIILLVALLYFEKRDSTRGRLLTKPFLSALFVAVALTGPKPDPAYVYRVLAGLLFCLAGDVFLIFASSKKLFLAGLVSFLTGHILYAVAFFLGSQPGMLTWIAGACFLVLSGVIFARLRPHLGRMLRPVAAYISSSPSWSSALHRSWGTKQEISPAGYSYFPGPSSSTSRIYSSPASNSSPVATSIASWGCPCITLAQFMIAFSIRFL